MSIHGFTSVVLDVDSTLSGIEGIDWLAERRGRDVQERVQLLTSRAMAGEIALESVYGERLALVSPDWSAVSELTDAYCAALAPNVESVIQQLRSAERHVVLVSGGIREAIVPMAVQLGIPARDVHAVSLRFGSSGDYQGFDEASPLTTATGKRTVVESLHLARRVLAVGDGVTDLAMRGTVDAFAAFTGFVRREPVVELADFELSSFNQLAEHVLS